MCSSVAIDKFKYGTEMVNRFQLIFKQSNEKKTFIYVIHDCIYIYKPYTCQIIYLLKTNEMDKIYTIEMLIILSQFSLSCFSEIEFEPKTQLRQKNQPFMSQWPNLRTG